MTRTRCKGRSRPLPHASSCFRSTMATQASTPTSVSREWNREYGTMTAVKSSLGSLSAPDDRSVTADTDKDRNGRRVDCYSGILACLATFHQPHGGFHAITLINVHFHRMPAKQFQGCRNHYRMFFDNIAELVPDTGPAILAGDFNMACFNMTTGTPCLRTASAPTAPPRGRGHSP